MSESNDAPRPRTVRVRIAVAVTPEGLWNSDGAKLGEYGGYVDPKRDHHMSGFARRYLEDEYNCMCRVSFIEADVPLPDPGVVEPAIKACVTEGGVS